MNKLFNYVSGFGDCTSLKNIKKFIGLENGETYGLDISGNWHNGYAVLDDDNNKHFLSRWELSDNDKSELYLEQVEFETSGNDLNVDFETLRNY